MPVCNSTLSDIYIHEDPLWHGFTYHHFGLFLCAIFGGIATLIGLVLIFLHATHYLRPYEQRHIIRILLLIPIYSVVSFLSYLEYRHAIYFDVLEGCYEAFAISSFFTLLCHYIAPNLHLQKEYFRSLVPVNWFWGVFGLQLCTGGQNKGPFRKPRSGLTWFNVIWIGVFQYCLIRVLFTIVAVIAQLNDIYCEESLSPVFAHVWVQGFEAASVTVAMFCLIQFYIQLKNDLSEHRPFLKVLCIKLVIFFSFWQSIVISFLSSERGPLQPTKTLAYPDIKVGIPSTLLCIEMAIFACMHIFAFPWKPYSLKHSYSDPLMAPGAGYSGGDPASMKYQGGFLGWKALVDAFNPWDIMKQTARGFRWLFVGARKRHLDESYQNNPAKMGFDGQTSYSTSTFAATGEPGTELRDHDPSYDMSRGRDTTFAEDDRMGLLRQPGHMGRMPSASPYRSQQGLNDDYVHVNVNDLQMDLGQQQPPPGTAITTSHAAAYKEYDVKPSDFRNHSSDDEDTPYNQSGAYNPGYGPATGGTAAGGAGAGAQGLHGGVHPVFRASAEHRRYGDVEDDRPPAGYWPGERRR